MAEFLACAAGFLAVAKKTRRTRSFAISAHFASFPGKTEQLPSGNMLTITRQSGRFYGLSCC
jgi:hypothetical protein